MYSPARRQTHPNCYFFIIYKFETSCFSHRSFFLPPSSSSIAYAKQAVSFGVQFLFPSMTDAQPQTASHVLYLSHHKQSRYPGPCHRLLLRASKIEYKTSILFTCQSTHLRRINHINVSSSVIVHFHQHSVYFCFPPSYTSSILILYGTSVSHHRIPTLFLSE